MMTSPRSRARKFYNTFDRKAKAAAAMQAGSPIERLRRQFSYRLVKNAHHRCFVCDRCVVRGGGCPGVRQSDPASWPICHSIYGDRPELEALT